MFIYKWINKINGKIYIGMSTRTPKKRLSDYRSEVNQLNKGKYKGSRDIIVALAEFGFDNFIFKILEEGFTDPFILGNRETELISKYNSTNKDIGYNLLPGGFYGAHSSETIKKMKNIQTKKVSDPSYIPPNIKIPKSEHPILLELFNNGMMPPEIGLKYNVDPTQIRRILKQERNRLGLPKPIYYSKIDISEYPKIIELFTIGTSTKNIANKYNVSQSIINKILRKNGFGGRKPKRPHKTKVSPELAEQIRSEYQPGVMDYRKLAKKYNLSWWMIGQIVKRKGFFSK